MIGEGTWSVIPLLVAGAFVAWWRLRRPLASAWSREGVTAGAEEAPYRRSTQRVPIAGAPTYVVRLVLYVFAMGFVGAGRVVMTWITIVNLIDDGHMRANLVPKDLRSVALQIALAVNGLAIAIHLPRAARSLARRTEDAPRNVRRAVVAAAFGFVLAIVDARVLYQATEKPPIYWVMGMLTDDAAYALVSAVACAALVVLHRASKRAPEIDPAAVHRGGPSKLEPILTVAGVLLAIAVVTHAVVYARQRVQVHREINGELPISIAGAKAERSEDGSFSIWMPADTDEVREEKVTPHGTVQAVKRRFDRSDAVLSLTWFDLAAGDERTLGDLCREAKERTLGNVGAPIMSGEGKRGSCDIRGARAAGDFLLRIVMDGRRVYELDAGWLPSPAAELFLRSFEVHGVE